MAPHRKTDRVAIVEKPETVIAAYANGGAVDSSGNTGSPTGGGSAGAANPEPTCWPKPALRKQAPDQMRPEMEGLTLAYHAVCAFLYEIAVEEDLDPGVRSFVHAVRGAPPVTESGFRCLS